MIANIIHNPQRSERLATLKEELFEQGITEYILWPAIMMQPPRTGISRAHKQIVAWAKLTNQEEVFILEDDVKFTSPNSYEHFLDLQPEDFDLYLGGIYRGQIKNGLTENFSALHCYIIHSRFYDTFLSADESEDIDNWCAGKGKFVVCNPMIAIQHIGWSDNNQCMADYDDLLADKRLYGMDVR